MILKFTERNIRATKPRYTPPKGIGYFMNLLSKLNRWIERENKRGADIPRFTKVQVRRIALYLENHHLFNFDILRKDKGAARRARIMAARMDRTEIALEARVEEAPLQAGTGPAPTQRRRPTLDDQVREFKRIVREENEKVPTKVVDELS